MQQLPRKSECEPTTMFHNSSWLWPSYRKSHPPSPSTQNQLAQTTSSHTKLRTATSLYTKEFDLALQNPTQSKTHAPQLNTKTKAPAFGATSPIDHGQLRAPQQEYVPPRRFQPQIDTYPPKLPTGLPSQPPNRNPENPQPSKSSPARPKSAPTQRPTSAPPSPYLLPSAYKCGSPASLPNYTADSCEPGECSPNKFHRMPSHDI